MEEKRGQDFYWESPCEKCHYRKTDQSVSGWTSLLTCLLIVAVCASVYFWNESESANSKLQNCLYIDESGSLHSVKNGQDWNMLDSDYLKDIVQNPDILDEDY